MIAVLIDSQKKGSSSWVAVRSAREVHVTGMQKGDFVKVHFYHGVSEKITWLELEEDFIVEIPYTCSRVKGEQIDTSGGGRIFIDLR